MTVTILSALMGRGIGLAFAIAIYAWRRTLRRGRPAAGSLATAYSAAGESVNGIRPGELEDFRRSARDQLHSQRKQWDRDYHPDTATGLPGRVAGIPRALRVRQ